MLNDRWYYHKLGRGAIIATQSHDLRGAHMRSSAAVRFPLFVCRFCALRGQKRHTDNMGSTMLPQAEQRSNTRSRKSCQSNDESQCVVNALAINLAAGANLATMAGRIFIVHAHMPVWKHFWAIEREK